MTISSWPRSEVGVGECVKECIKHERPNGLSEVEGVLDRIMSIIN